MDECIFFTDFNFMRATNTVPPHHTQRFPTVHSAAEPLPVLLLCSLLSVHWIYLTNSIYFLLLLYSLSIVLSVACLNSQTTLFPSCFAMHAIQLWLCLSRKYPASPPSPSSFKVSDFPCWQAARGCTPGTSPWVCSVTTGPDSPPAN